MDHRMAVRTDREKVLYRIDFVLCPDLCQRLDVMNVNDPLAEGAIPLPEVEATRRAGCAVMVNAGVPCLTTALVSVHTNRTNGAFDYRCGGIEFLGEASYGREDVRATLHEASRCLGRDLDTRRTGRPVERRIY